MLYGLASELRDCEPGSLKSATFPELTTVVRLAEEKVHGMFTWNELMVMGSDVSDEGLASIQLEQQIDDEINIQYTSGTTGFPKGTTLSHHNILNNGYFVARLQNLTHEDRLCIPVPLYHCFGMVMGNLGCITHGATMVYPSEGFDPLAVLQAVQEERCTSLYGVPTMFIAELGYATFSTFDLTSLRTGVMAGSPCPAEIMRRVIDQMHMREVEICYGMTETSPVSTQTRIDAPIDKRVGTSHICSRSQTFASFRPLLCEETGFAKPAIRRVLRSAIEMCHLKALEGKSLFKTRAEIGVRACFPL